MREKREAVAATRNAVDDLLTVGCNLCIKKLSNSWLELEPRLLQICTCSPHEKGNQHLNLTKPLSIMPEPQKDSTPSIICACSSCLKGCLSQVINDLFGLILSWQYSRLEWHLFHVSVTGLSRGRRVLVRLLTPKTSNDVRIAAEFRWQSFYHEEKDGLNGRYGNSAKCMISKEEN